MSVPCQTKSNDLDQALQRLGSEAADEKGLAMACTLHANLSLVYLQEAVVPMGHLQRRLGC